MCTRRDHLGQRITNHVVAYSRQRACICQVLTVISSGFQASLFIFGLFRITSILMCPEASPQCGFTIIISPSRYARASSVCSRSLSAQSSHKRRIYCRFPTLLPRRTSSPSCTHMITSPSYHLSAQAKTEIPHTDTETQP